MGIVDGTNDSSDVCKKSSQSQKFKISVIGAAGPMGSSICENLKRKGHEVLAFDWTENEHEGETEIWNKYEQVNLWSMDDCLKVTREVDWVINFVSFTPGPAFSESNASKIMCDNALIGESILEAARISGVRRYFQASIIFTHMGTNLCIDGCRTEPQFSNDFGNLDTELLCQGYRREYQFESRIGRFYCLYGPLGTWHGGKGKGKAPAAFCLEASISPDKVEMRGQIDALKAVRKYAKDVVRLMESDPGEPEFIGILDSRELWDIGSGEIVSKKLTKESSEMGLRFEDENLLIQRIPGPEQIFGPNSDNTLIEEDLQGLEVLKLKKIKERIEKVGSLEVVSTVASVELDSL